MLFGISRKISLEMREKGKNESNINFNGEAKTGRLEKKEHFHYSREEMNFI
jgi:hypothetical protein